MAMSANAAAKRRRAGLLLNSPMLQPPHILQSTPPFKLISELQNENKTSSQSSSNYEKVPQSVNNMSANNNISANNNMGANNNITSRGFTIQQIINLLDSRLISLEKKTPDVNISEVKSENVDVESIKNLVNEALTETLSEYDHRFEMLAGEIANIKTALLSLQTYTMEINKTLMQERIQILSEIQPSVNESFDVYTGLDCQPVDCVNSENNINLVQENARHIQVENVEECAVLDTQEEPPVSTLTEEDFENVDDSFFKSYVNPEDPTVNATEELINDVESQESSLEHVVEPILETTNKSKDKKKNQKKKSTILLEQEL